MIVLVLWLLFMIGLCTVAVGIMFGKGRGRR